MRRAAIIEVHKYGVHIHGPDGVDMGLLGVVMAYYSEQGHNRLCPGISDHLNGGFVLASEKNAAAWSVEIEAKIAHLDPLERWWQGIGRGNSAITIVHALTNRRPPGFWRESTPSDVDDFSRCVGLLDAVPGLRERMPEVAAKYPNWDLLVTQWADLETEYRLLGTSKAALVALNKKIQALRRNT